MLWRSILVPRPALAVRPRWWLGLGAIAVGLAGCGAASTGVPSSRAAVGHPVVLLASSQAFGVAYTTPVSETQSRLSFFNSMTGQSEVIGPSADYVSVRLSPDGSTLAALAAAPPGQSSTLELTQLSSLSTLPLSLPAAAQATYVVWSPDGRQFAVLGATTFLFNSDGSRVGTANATLSGSGYSSGGYGWSPDSQYFATIIDGSLMVLGQNGAAFVTQVGNLIPVAPDPGDLWAFSGWGSDSTISLVSFPSGGQSWNITVSGSGPESATPGGAATTVTQGPPLGSALNGQLANLVPGGQPMVMWSQPSADGGAEVYGIRSASAPSSPVILAVSYPSTSSVVRLPVSPQATRDGALVDVVALGT